MSIAQLPHRAVVEVSGADRASFLQGLVSNDVALAAPGRAVWAALLTPQGKFLAEFFILSEPDRLLLDCERAQAAMLVQRLARYRLRAKVEIRDLSAALGVYAAWDGVPDVSAITAPDPRLALAGWRVLAPAPIPTTATEADWDIHRLRLGLPDGTRDLEPDKTVLLEAGFDELNGVSWTKGCYMGQELTARTHYRGLLKRRLVPVGIEGPPPPVASAVYGDGREVGTMRSSRGAVGLALLRLDALAAPLRCGEAHLEVRIPDWMRLS